MLGSWVQLVDDLFDLCDDVLNGIKTPVTDCKNTTTLCLWPAQGQHDAFVAIENLAQPAARNKRRFLTGFSLYGKLADRYLRQVEKEIGGAPSCSFAKVEAVKAVQSGTWKVLFN